MLENTEDPHIEIITQIGTIFMNSRSNSLDIYYMDSIIYIVDDDVFFADVLKRKLVKHGFTQIYTCVSATDFLSEMNVKPDLVFLDYDLGDLTGIDVLLKLKKYSPNSQIIMVSGQEKEKIVNDALDMGAHRYISKGQVNMNNQIEEAILTVELN